MINPLKVHRERQEKKSLEKKIRDESIVFGDTLSELSRKKLIYLYEKYSIKYGREYRNEIRKWFKMRTKIEQKIWKFALIVTAIDGLLLLLICSKNI